MKRTLGSPWAVLLALSGSCLAGGRATASIIVLTNEKTVTNVHETHTIMLPPGPLQTTRSVSPAAVALPDGGFEVLVNGTGSYSHGGGLQISEDWQEVKVTFSFELDAPAEYFYRSGPASVFFPGQNPVYAAPPDLTFEGGPRLPTPSDLAAAESSGVLPAGRYTLTAVGGRLPPYSEPPQPAPVPIELWVFKDFTFRVAPEPGAFASMLGAGAMLTLRRGRRRQRFLRPRA